LEIGQQPGHLCGGCRALAYWKTGNVFAEDPTCFFDPSDGEERSELEPVQTAHLEEFVEYIKYTEPWNTFF